MLCTVLHMLYLLALSNYIFHYQYFAVQFFNYLNHKTVDLILSDGEECTRQLVQYHLWEQRGSFFLISNMNGLWLISNCISLCKLYNTQNAASSLLFKVGSCIQQTLYYSLIKGRIHLSFRPLASYYVYNLSESLEGQQETTENMTYE